MDRRLKWHQLGPRIFPNSCFLRCLMGQGLSLKFRDTQNAIIFYDFQVADTTNKSNKSCESIQAHASYAAHPCTPPPTFAAQALGLFQQLTVVWPEPLNTVLNFLSLLTFDLEVVRIQCLFTRDDPLTNYVARIMVRRYHHHRSRGMIQGGTVPIGKKGMTYFRNLKKRCTSI